jgi:Fe-Mn family superoxide dismutase
LNRVLPGWIWLGVTKQGNMTIQQTNNEDNPLMKGVVDTNSTPIFGIDLWEHAYFYQYKGDKGAYVDAFFKQINWDKLSSNFEQFNSKGKVAPILEL